eukprot:m.979911 g.979911  ORF g.979911 m.979911 type:complete len:250 (+) comp23962_c0_seq10:176-925(+)
MGEPSVFGTIYMGSVNRHAEKRVSSDLVNEVIRELVRRDSGTHRTVTVDNAEDCVTVSDVFSNEIVWTSRLSCLQKCQRGQSKDTEKNFVLTKQHDDIVEFHVFTDPSKQAAVANVALFTTAFRQQARRNAVTRSLPQIGPDTDGIHVYRADLDVSQILNSSISDKKGTATSDTGGSKASPPVSKRRFGRTKVDKKKSVTGKQGGGASGVSKRCRCRTVIHVQKPAILILDTLTDTHPVLSWKYSWAAE